MPEGKPTVSDEAARASYLRDAEGKAVQLFEAIEKDLVRSGVSEKDLSKEIYDLGFKLFDIKTHWHKRVVRSGPNTLCPFEENPPDRIIEEDDILIVDLGPVFEAWEADFGRTFVLGNDPAKIKLRDALEPMWHKVKALYDGNPDMTGEQLYDIACENAKSDGWIFGAYLAGHIVGSFPHERIPRDKISLYITKGNDKSMNCIGNNGFKRHWILEIHLRNPDGRFGGFFEQLLTA
ncbi:hypothetical protein QQS21_003155 [Conoideocrella luteorostrata]|uniref:Peptidase M24 domain-containing protein n=1 Tax=Conoideocrella luteorostrata TaxID=1105319 RepID=A0AAJ0CXX8_9HYPO|nr:hypothetical protein QQS21_003155 [Conoideocrella luteorostrata]